MYKNFYGCFCLIRIQLPQGCRATSKEFLVPREEFARFQNLRLIKPFNNRISLPEVFCKKRFTEKFRKIHRNAHELEPLF